MGCSHLVEMVEQGVVVVDALQKSLEEVSICEQTEGVEPALYDAWCWTEMLSIFEVRLSLADLKSGA